MRAASYSLPVLRCSDVTRTIGASGNFPWKNEKYNNEAIKEIKKAFYYKWRRVNASLNFAARDMKFTANRQISLSSL